MGDDLPAAVVADLFWELLGCEPHYPCDLEELLLWSQPEDFRLTFDAVPGLDLAAVNRRALQLNMAYRIDEPNRPLRGCLLADWAGASILYDPGDALDEQRFTKAHELAHFLNDYYLPRRRALQLLGEGIRPVLDDQRPANLAERLHAAMLQVRLGPLTSLMERPDEGLPDTRVLMIEDRADRIALELLAPAQWVSQRLERALPRIGRAQQQPWLVALLQDEFGLPQTIAVEYASAIIRQRGGSALLDWLACNISEA